MVASPQLVRETALFCLLLLTVSACSASSQSANNVSSTSNECPEKGRLSNNNVKSVSLNGQTLKESGMVSPDKNQGYTFEAKSGQKISYHTKGDICIWLYSPDNQLLNSPDNQLLNSKVLSQTGKYTIQLASRQGAQTFELEMGLDTSLQKSPSPTHNTTTASLPLSQAAVTSAPNRPAADEFVKNYYLALKNRNYSDTWSKLSPKFQSLSTDGYSDYLQWWNSVSDITVGNIHLVNQSSDAAIVDAELYYVMNTGKAFEDSKKRIYLVWSDPKNSWLFERKTSP